MKIFLLAHSVVFFTSVAHVATAATVNVVNESENSLTMTLGREEKFNSGEAVFVVVNDEVVATGGLKFNADGTVNLNLYSSLNSVKVGDEIEISRDPTWIRTTLSEQPEIEGIVREIKQKFVLLTFNDKLYPLFSVNQSLDLRIKESKDVIPATVVKFGKNGMWIKPSKDIKKFSPETKVSLAMPLVAKRNSKLNSSSSDIRRHQRYEGDLLYTPLSDFLLSYGISASYATSSRSRFGLTALMGSKSGNTVLTKDAAGHFEATGNTQFVHFRYYTGNSFSLLTGVGNRTAIFRDRIVFSDGVVVNTKITSQSYIVPFFIGNTWTWQSGLTFGIDWIGMMFPFSGSSKVSVNGNLSGRELDSWLETSYKVSDKIVKMTSITFALTSIGWAF